MHHDSRTYIEVRYDTQTADIVVVNFRDRGILPIETFSREFSVEAPDFTGDSELELRTVLLNLLEALRK